jgi:hypothetical protein
MNTLRLFALLALCLPNGAFSQFDVQVLNYIPAAANGLHGNGCSAVDFDQDGFDDLTLASGEDGVFIYRNLGNGQYEDANYPIVAEGDVKQVLWVDYDNDDDLDLFITRKMAPVMLWRNDGDGNFINVSAQAGFIQTSTWETFGASFGDYDNDGDLDVYLNNYNVIGNVTNYLYRNNGNGTFTDVTTACNCSNGVQNTFQSLWYDANNDGWLDLVVINDRLFYANALYLNEGDGSFVDVAPQMNFDQMVYAMSITCGDYDNDNDFDFYITNGYEGNLFLTRSGNTFTDYAEFNNTTVNSVCWGALWIDYDNDRLQDLYVADYPWGAGSSPNHFFRNNTGINFIENNGLIQNDQSNLWSVSMGDFDSNGFPDILMSTVTTDTRLMINQGGENHWLKVGLKGTVSNSYGVGSKVSAFTNGVRQNRFTYCGESYLGQNSLQSMFGLKAAETIDSLLVTWPSGHTDRLYDLPADTSIVVTEGQSFTPNHYIEGNPCSGTSVTLVIDEPGAFAFWSTGEEGLSIDVSESGVYSAGVTNSIGITKEVVFEVEFTPSPNMVVNTTPVTCPGWQDGSIELFNVMGVPIESVIWDDGAFSGIQPTDLAGGTYSYNALDINGCHQSGEVTIEEPDPFNVEVEVSHPSCFGETGSAQISASGGTGELSIDWLDDDPQALPGGAYELTLTDEASCIHTFGFEVIEPPLLEVDLSIIEAQEGANGSATVVASGGLPPYNIQWSTGDQGETLNDLGQGIYSVIVSDSNDCFWSESFEIIDLSIEPAQSDFDMLCTLSFTGAAYRIVSNANHGLQIELYTVSGKRIESASIAPGQFIDLPINRYNGMFLLHVTDGQTSEVFKLIM